MGEKPEEKKEEKEEAVVEVEEIEVDYGLSLEKVIGDCQFHSVNSNITTKSFPTSITGRRKVRIILVHSKDKISHEKALALVHKHGRPATIQEGLAFLKHNLKKGIDDSKVIVFLGSIYGNRFVPFVSDSRRLDHHYATANDWPAECYFAVVQQ